MTETFAIPSVIRVFRLLRYELILFRAGIYLILYSSVCTDRAAAQLFSRHPFHMFQSLFLILCFVLFIFLLRVCFVLLHLTVTSRKIVSAFFIELIIYSFNVQHSDIYKSIGM